MLLLAALLGCAGGLSIPDACIGMGGFCNSDEDCQVAGREGVCLEDSRCHQACHATASRTAQEIPKSMQYCCDYGQETPRPSVPLELPKHWGEPRFRGKRVLVTGGDSGIGLAAVQAFYLECAQVLLTGHSSAKTQSACELVSSLPVPSACGGSKPRVACMAADVRNASQVTEMVARAVRDFGGLDIAVNNAGVGGNVTRQIGDPKFLDHSGNLYDDSIMDVNIKGTLKCMNAEIGYWLNKSLPGVIVNVASIAGEVSWGGPLYTSSKWAMIGFTRQAALHTAPRGIRVNTLAPGAVNTTMLRGGLPSTDPRWIAAREALEAMIPAGRIAEPWEMAGPITFLASDMASYITGATLTADGDLSQAMPSKGHLAENEFMPVASASGSSWVV